MVAPSFAIDFGERKIQKGKYKKFIGINYCRFIKRYDSYAYNREADATHNHGIRQKLHQRDLGIEFLDIIRERYYSLVSSDQKPYTCDDRIALRMFVAANRQQLSTKNIDLSTHVKHLKKNINMQKVDFRIIINLKIFKCKKNSDTNKFQL